MDQVYDLGDVEMMAAAIDAEIRSLPVRNTPSIRSVRRQYSRQLRQAPPAFMLDLAKELMARYEQRWVAYELLRYHKEAFQALGESELEMLGQGIDSWWSVDAFGRTLAGPAWLKGQVSGDLIHRWAHSQDRWWRRAALVSTVGLNMRSEGGRGDVAGTLAVCRSLAGDHDDMVVKALSWALRELVPHDPGAVRDFLGQHEQVLATRVKREVRNKLRTGLKNPRHEN